MRRLHENRFYRDDALTPENITTIFEAFGWTSIRRRRIARRLSNRPYYKAAGTDCPLSLAGRKPVCF